MTDSDDKLKAIILMCRGEGAIADIPHHVMKDSIFEGIDMSPEPVEKRIEQIKQVFADAGYTQPGNMDYLKQFRKPTLPDLMSGQEWFDRFEKELTAMALDVHYEYKEDLDFVEVDSHSMTQVRLAARRAAGLE